MDFCLTYRFKELGHLGNAKGKTITRQAYNKKKKKCQVDDPMRQEMLSIVHRNAGSRASCKPVKPSGKVLARLVNRKTSAQSASALLSLQKLRFMDIVL